MIFISVIIGTLFVLAISDLIVGVSNDAVNFTNSAIGSRIAKRRTVLIVSGIGILIGTVFSTGMMSIARNGIFEPSMFVFSEIMIIFSAVMFADVILLDFYNTYGLPTSTTVSLIFELIGASVAISFLKIVSRGDSLDLLAAYINSDKILAIISGIMLSVVIAFTFGTAIQFITRLIFTFNYSRPLKIFGGLWGALMINAFVYFIVLKGLKTSIWANSGLYLWVNSHTWEVMSAVFVLSWLVLQIILLLTRWNIFKFLILAGTFSLALAFAANDLVNFIGVPLAGLHAFTIASENSAPLMAPMEALNEPVTGNPVMLITAGLIMSATLWYSKKARAVTKTELELSRQFKGKEPFGKTYIAEIIVNLNLQFFRFVRMILPEKFQKWVNHRLDVSQAHEKLGLDSKIVFDQLRAAVNLMVSSALIAFGTSLKLPLSTTYVTFMVAMGSSFADRSWGLDTAVTRVNGVLTVIGGWFMTAVGAFTIAFILATVIYFGETVGLVLCLMLSVLYLLRSQKVFKRRSAKKKKPRH